MVASHVFNWLSTIIAKLGIAIYRFTNGIVRSDIDNSLDVSPMTCIQTQKMLGFVKQLLQPRASKTVPLILLVLHHLNIF